MFADDYSILCKAKKHTANNIKQNLDHYCMVSGQLINYKKNLY